MEISLHTNQSEEIVPCNRITSQHSGNMALSQANSAQALHRAPKTRKSKSVSASSEMRRGTTVLEGLAPCSRFYPRLTASNSRQSNTSRGLSGVACE